MYKLKKYTLYIEIKLLIFAPENTQKVLVCDKGLNFGQTTITHLGLHDVKLE